MPCEMKLPHLLNKVHNKEKEPAYRVFTNTECRLCALSVWLFADCHFQLYDIDKVLFVASWAK